ncbi:MAG: hypothetical protein ACHQ53_02005 [Polyangiales bacterium]
MQEPAPDDDREREDSEAPEPEEDVMATLFRVVRRFLPPFLFSWLLAYAGSQGAGDVVFYAGLGGVGLSILGLLLWLLHH